MDGGDCGSKKRVGEKIAPLGGAGMSYWPKARQSGGERGGSDLGAQRQLSSRTMWLALGKPMKQEQNLPAASWAPGLPI